MTLITKLDVKIYSHESASPGHHCTRVDMKAPWLSRRPERETWVLLYHCCYAAAVVSLLLCRYCCSVYRGCAISFVISKKCGFIRPAPAMALLMRLGVMFVPISYDDRKHGTHPSTNRSGVRGRHKREELDVRLLLYRGRRKVTSSRAGGTV